MMARLRRSRRVTQFSVIGLMTLVAIVALILNEIRPVGRAEAIQVARELIRKRQPDFPIDECSIDAFYNTSLRWGPDGRGRFTQRPNCWAVTFGRSPKTIDCAVAIKTRWDALIVVP